MHGLRPSPKSSTNHATPESREDARQLHWFFNNQPISVATLKSKVHKSIEAYGYSEQEFKTIEVVKDVVNVYFEVTMTSEKDPQIGELMDELSDLKDQLARFVAKGEFLRAEKVNQQIKSLESQIAELNREACGHGTKRFEVKRQFRNTVWVTESPHTIVYMGSVSTPISRETGTVVTGGFIGRVHDC